MSVTIRFPLLEEVLQYLSLFDSPGTYIMIMVFGLVLVPYYVGSIYDHIKNPQEYYMVSFEKKFWIGFLVILFLLVFGLANYLRFLPG